MLENDFQQVNSDRKKLYILEYSYDFEYYFLFYISSPTFHDIVCLEIKKEDYKKDVVIFLLFSKKKIQNKNG